MKLVYKFILLLALIIFQLQSFAQGCSTCRAQIISSTKDDLTIGNGLNTGILFFLFRKNIFNIYKSFKPN